MPNPSRGNPVMRFGSIFGAILALVAIASIATQWFSGAYATSVQNTTSFTTVHLSDTGLSSMFNCVVFLAMLGLTFVAGWQTAKRKGTAASGSIAGLIAGVIGELVGGGMTIAVILLFVSPQLRMPTNSYLTLPQAQVLLIGATIFGVVVGVLLAAGCGAGMGALGGLVGANTYRQRMTQAQAAAQAAAQTRGQPPMYLGMPDQP